MPGLTRSLALCVLGLCLLLGQAYASHSSGCNKTLKPGIKGGSTGESNKINFTTSKGAKRTFLLHLPTTYDKTKPHGLIFSYHGRTDTGAGQEQLTKLSEPANNPHMIVVYPDGIDKEWQGDPKSHADDVGFTLDMIKSLKSELCIDTNKIFSSGMSNGGGFSVNVLACDPVASKKIAAFAASSGAYYEGSDKDCKPATIPISCNPGRKPIPILEFHGSADKTIAYAGGPRRGGCLPTIPHFITSWAERDGLGSSNKTTASHEGHVKKYVFGSETHEGAVTHYWIDGMGHTWPKSKSHYIDASPLMVDFFDKWTLGKTGSSSVGTSKKHTTHASTSKKSTATNKSPSYSSTTKKHATHTGTAKKHTTHTGTTKKPTASNKPPSYSSTTRSSAKPKRTALCPSRNGKNWSTGGKAFYLTCSADTPNASYCDATHPKTFRKCIAECAKDAKCGHVAYNGATCYKKTGKPAQIKGSSNPKLRIAVKE